MIQWLLVLFLNASDIGLVSGPPYASHEDCEREGRIRYALVELQQEPTITSVTWICVMQKKEKG